MQRIINATKKSSASVLRIRTLYFGFESGSVLRIPYSYSVLCFVQL